MAPITAALTTVSDLVGGIFTMIVDNPLLVVFVAMGLTGSAIGLFSQLKNSAQ
jgi:hypothetical protein